MFNSCIEINASQCKLKDNYVFGFFLEYLNPWFCARMSSASFQLSENCHNYGHLKAYVLLLSVIKMA